MNKLQGIVAGTLTIVSLYSGSAAAATPEGWLLAGKDPASYRLEVDSKVAHAGKASAYLGSTRQPEGFGTMMQNVDPAEYRGKRLRLSVFLKTQDIKKWAGVWMRVDGPDKKPLGFDNMQDRPIKGSSDWTRHDVVLDVPVEATNIGFGVLMDGEGKLWADDFQLQVVDTTVPVTGSGMGANTKPRNLDFER